MRRMLVLSVSILTIFFANVSIAQLSNASDDKSNVSIDTDTCDSLSADSISTNPISAVGHGAIVNAEGEEIDVTLEVILEAQRYYLRTLFHQADEKQRSKLRKIQKRLLKGRKCDQQVLVHVNSELIAWLIDKVKPENASGLASINAFLRQEFATNDDGSREILEQESLPTLLSATNLSGEAYIEECKAAGVPIPPDWGSPKWKPEGILRNEFISQKLKAEVFTFKESSGICFALPRICLDARDCLPTEFDKITLLGIICQGSDTSKACFWDNQRKDNQGNNESFPIEKNTTVPLADFAGGAGLVGANGLAGAGICSDCHAGENPFIVHPDTPLDLKPTPKPKNWPDPLVPAGWPGNPGPTKLLDGIVLGSGDNSCIGCHSQPVFGRFPEVSKELPGYCSAVLQNAIRRTMPPSRPGDASYRKHINALTAACGMSKGLIASDNSIKAANSPKDSFTPCFGTGECPVKKTVTFTLEERADIFVTYDLGQSHGCCDDHEFGVLQIFRDGTDVRKDQIRFVNYGVQPFFLEDFDYFFPPEVVEGFDRPVSQLDSALVGPRLENYKVENRFPLGSLDAGPHTVELQVGDAGWNSIFEILR